MNADKKLDLVVAHKHLLTVLFGKDGGAFDKAVPLPDAAPLEEFRSVAIMNVDGKRGQDTVRAGVVGVERESEWVLGG